MRICILLLALSLSFTTWADEGRPTYDFKDPAELLKKAKEGRHEFVDVVFNIRNYFFKDRPKEELYTYFSLLNELEEIQTAHQFPTFDVKPMKVLAKRMVILMLDEISFFKDDRQIILDFLKWSDETQKFELLEKQQIRFDDQKYTGKQVYTLLGHTWEVYRVSKEKDYPAFLLDKLLFLESLAVKRVFSLSELVDEKLISVVHKVKGPESIKVMIAKMMDRFFTKPEELDIQQSAVLMNEVFKRGTELDPRNDRYVLTSISGFASRLLIFYIESKSVIPEYKTLPSMILPSDYLELFNYYYSFNFDEVQIEKAEMTLNVLLMVQEHYRRVNRTKYEAISIKIGRLKIKDVAAKIEGHYEVELSGVKGRLSIFQSSFYNLKYILTTYRGEVIGIGAFSRMSDNGKIIIAEHDFSANDFNGNFHSKRFIEFKVAEDNSIAGRYVSELTKMSFSGKKQTGFAWPETGGAFELEAGHYKGSSGKFNFDLTIKKSSLNIYEAELVTHSNVGGNPIFHHFLVYYRDSKGHYFLTNIDASERVNLRKLSLFKVGEKFIGTIAIGSRPVVQAVEFVK